MGIMSLLFAIAILIRAAATALGIFDTPSAGVWYRCLNGFLSIALLIPVMSLLHMLPELMDEEYVALRNAALALIRSGAGGADEL